MDPKAEYVHILIKSCFNINLVVYSSRMLKNLKSRIIRIVLNTQ